jgi:hypothetical protein
MPLLYALLLQSELCLLAFLSCGKRYRETPLLVIFAIFAVGSFVTYNPYDVGFTSYMARLSDWLKAGLVAEAFWLLSRGLDAADRTLSAAIGVLSAASVLAAAHGLSSRVSTHLEALIGMASFSAAMCWWAWRRGECQRYALALTGYLLAKCGAVLAWNWTDGWGWKWINGAAMLGETACFMLWVNCGPQVASPEGQAESGDGYKP